MSEASLQEVTEFVCLFSQIHYARAKYFKVTSNEMLFSLFHTRNNRGKVTALMELVLETLPKIYILPTRDSVGTIRKEVEFIFNCVIPESTNCLTSNTASMKIKSSGRTTSKISPTKMF
jgi:hypothetical protein